MQLFKFTQQDLAHNLSGQLSTAQKERIKRQRTKFSILWSVLSVFPCFIAGMFFNNLWVFAVLWLITIVMVVFLYRQWANEIIARNDFRVYRGTIGIFRLKGRMYLTFPGHQLAIPPAAASLLSRTQAYNIHFVRFWDSSLILSIAPTDVKIERPS
jgi:hypothetical protein